MRPADAARDHRGTTRAASTPFSTRRKRIKGIGTGFLKFDEMTGGLHGGELFILAARPSMGKTALALNIAQHVATQC